VQAGARLLFGANGARRKPRERRVLLAAPPATRRARSTPRRTAAMTDPMLLVTSRPVGTEIVS
jgi:hypothetical protein